jgi:hypothetical protein
MQTSSVRAVLFVKDLGRAAAFYIGALAMTRASGDEDHAVLDCDGFELVVHRMPKPIADTSVADSRRLARSLGGEIDDAPPAWADRNANLFFGHDPEGNQFGVRQRK